MSRLFLCCLILGSVLSTTFGLLDVVVQDLGCWKESPQKPLISSLEGEDELLDGPYQTRFEALQKCAKVTQKLGLRYFALRDGGLCATGPWVEQNFTVLGMSEDCEISGRGGIWANQVYMINTIWDAKYVPLGCWRKDIEGLESLEGKFVRLMDDWETRKEAEEKCARAAASLGNVIFALWDNGHCYSWARPQQDLKWFAKSTDCGIKRQGGEEGVQIYHLTTKINVTLIDLGCWECDKNDRTIPLIESRSEILGAQDYKIREDAIERCALYNADWNNGNVFAVTDGGACAGSEATNVKYDALGQSEECTLDGKGSAQSNQVYKIIRQVKNITYELEEPHQPLHLTRLGCWKDAEVPLIPSLEGADIDLKEPPLERADPVWLCAKAARRRGYDLFAVQEGKCFSSLNARSLFQTLGPEEGCSEIGGVQANYVYEINTVIDPWYTNEGCFEQCDSVTPFVSLEGANPWLEDSPRIRREPIKKCSWVAASLNYTSFALMDGGQCFGLKIESIRDCIKSAACADDGEGGRSAIQLYNIKAINNITLENLGCWKDDDFRVIPTAEGSTLQLTGRYNKREDAIGECARYARSRGLKVFALQAGGMCMTSEKAGDWYNRYGWSNQCEEDGKGGVWANQVWRINEDWWSTPAEWWKVPEPWNKLGGWNCTWQWWKTPTAPWM